MDLLRDAKVGELQGAVLAEDVLRFEVAVNDLERRGERGEVDEHVRHLVFFKEAPRLVLCLDVFVESSVGRIYEDAELADVFEPRLVMRDDVVVDACTTQYVHLVLGILALCRRARLELDTLSTYMRILLGDRFDTKHALSELAFPSEGDLGWRLKHHQVVRVYGRRERVRNFGCVVTLGQLRISYALFDPRNYARTPTTYDMYTVTLASELVVALTHNLDAQTVNFLIRKFGDPGQPSTIYDEIVTHALFESCLIRYPSQWYMHVFCTLGTVRYLLRLTPETMIAISATLQLMLDNDDDEFAIVVDGLCTSSSVPGFSRAPPFKTSSVPMWGTMSCLTATTEMSLCGSVHSCSLETPPPLLNDHQRWL